MISFKKVSFLISLWVVLCSLTLSSSAQDYTKTPVFFVHGYGEGKWIWNALIDYLVNSGYPTEYLKAVYLDPPDGANIPAAEDQIAPAVEDFLEDVNEFLDTNYPQIPSKTKVDIVSTSMGGLSSRWYTARVRPDRVRCWVSLAGSNHGTDVLEPWAGIDNGGAGDCFPAFAANELESYIQYQLNGAPYVADVDETPYGVGADSSGVVTVFPDEQNKIFYVTINITDDYWIEPDDSAQLDGTGGMIIPIPGDLPATETSPGNIEMDDEDLGHDQMLEDPDTMRLVGIILNLDVGLLPSVPSNPVPSDGATSVGLETTLGWDGSLGADSYKIYFGESSPPPYVDDTTSSSYDPGTLSPNMTYYWKVVAVNSYGEIPGPEWSFTTCALPGIFSYICPTDGATNTSLTEYLDWDDSTGADSYDVHFGTAPSPPFVINVTASSYDPGTLNPGITYYWKIVAKNVCGETSGPEWSFTTICPLPSVPVNTSPTDKATDISTEADLDWDDSFGADSYDVYFGTSYPPPKVATVLNSSYNPGTMDYNTTYHWKVAAKNGCGEVSGSSWSFTTEPLPLPVYLIVDGHDYNGDGTSDISVWRPSNGKWYLKGMGAFTWGVPGDIPVSGDYNGDGVTEIAVWRQSNGMWYIRGTGGEGWGMSGDIPVPGNYDGDISEKTEIAVWRPSNGKWYIKGGGGQVWGKNGDIPVPGDYDGDGKTDVAVWRPSSGKWYIKGVKSLTWGVSGDVPVPGDYDGDGITEVAVWRPSNGRWFIKGVKSLTWGVSGDVPVPGDYDGDGITEVAVWRPSNGRWYVKDRGLYTWGMIGDIPLVR